MYLAETCSNFCQLDKSTDLVSTLLVSNPPKSIILNFKCLRDGILVSNEMDDIAGTYMRHVMNQYFLFSSRMYSTG